MKTCEDRRALFKIGQQKMFLCKAKENLGMEWTDFEKLIEHSGYSAGSLRNWRSETCTMPLSIVKNISKLSEVDAPEFEVKSRYWGSEKGGKTFVCRYGKLKMKELCEIGRKVTEKRHGQDAFKKFAKMGGQKAKEFGLGIFSKENMKNARKWRALPFKNKIGIFDSKYIEKRNEWRLKALMNSTKLSVDTNFGIKVRSKHEKQILEKLYEFGFDVIYEPEQIKSGNKFILPDFGFKDAENIFIEYLGRNDDAYWNYKIPRWKAVLKNSSAKFIIIAYDVKKTKEAFHNLSNVIDVLKFGEWEKLNDSLSQLCLKRKKSLDAVSNGE